MNRLCRPLRQTCSSALRARSLVRGYASGHESADVLTQEQKAEMKQLEREIAADWKLLEPNASVEVLFGPSMDIDSEYWNDQDNWDAHDYEWKCKVELLLYNWLRLPRAEHAKFRQDFDISKGYGSLEWVLPTPMPEHTFDELPIIKEVD